MAQTREEAAIHPVRAWLRFRLCSYLIVVVVALKFGRVLADYCRDRRDNRDQRDNRDHRDHRENPGA